MKIGAAIGPVTLAFLVFAGQLKETQLFAWLPVDMTLLASVVVVLCVLHARATLGPASARVAIPIVVWVLFLPPVALVSSFDGYVGQKVLTLFSVSLLLAIAPFYLMRTEVQRRVFLASLAAIAIVVTLYVIFVERGTTEWVERSVLEGTDTIGTARIAMAGSLVLLMHGLNGGDRVGWRIAWLASAFLAASLAIMTGSRGPVIGALIAALVAVVVAPAFRRFRGRALLALGAVGVIAVWVALSSRSDGIARLVALFLGEGDNSTRARTNVWSLATELAAVNPWGIGWGQFSAHSQHAYPHNLVLELAVETGWLVMGLVVIGLMWTLVRAARVATTPTLVAVLALLLFSTFNSMVSSDVNGNRLMIVTVFTVWAVSRRSGESALVGPALGMTQGRSMRRGAGGTRRG